jgi:hypothetical protein
MNVSVEMALTARGDAMAQALRLAHLIGRCHTELGLLDTRQSGIGGARVGGAR